jgi:hypothetical protein
MENLLPLYFNHKARHLSRTIVFGFLNGQQCCRISSSAPTIRGFRFGLGGCRLFIRTIQKIFSAPNGSRRR